jgi:hypothetical protein
MDDHWQSNPAREDQLHDVDVLDKAGNYLGQARIKQTDFGIQPISVAGGTIKVLNEVKIDFVIAVGK